VRGPPQSDWPIANRQLPIANCYNDTAMKRLAPLLVGLALFFTCFVFAENKDQKQKEQYADLAFVILKEDGEKPLRNAAVVLHPVDKNGHQSKGGVELKTDEEGRASFNAVPYGRLRIQVIMSGFQTYGEDIVIDQPKQEITVKLKRPQQQYSIYK